MSVCPPHKGPHLNSHMAHFTLDPSDIPTARSQTERTRFFAAPSAHSAVFMDGYYAVKPPILASLLKCYGAAQSNVSAGSCQDPNSSLTNDSDDDANDDTENDDDDDGDGGDGAVSQTGSPSCAC